MTLTFQKEVAERIDSPIMTTSRCRLSVMCQNWCDVEMKLLIPGKVSLTIDLLFLTFFQYFYHFRHSICTQT